MKNQILKFSVSIFLLLIGSSVLQAQDAFTVNKKQSKVIIEGTSNIHDWEMTVEDLDSQLFMSQASSEIKSITFKVPVKSMKSGKSRMDKNTYEALKAEDNGTIKFESTSIKESDGKLYAIGNLSIAGTTKNVKIPLELKKTQGRVSLTTSYKINMLDYNVEPPTAMFGTIKTGDTVDVKINLIY